MVRGWFQEGVAGEPFEYPFDPEDFEEEFRLTDGERSSEVFDLYRAACERSRRALEDVSLDDLVNLPGRDVPYRVRWIVVHMIEETARHAGHADILREQLGGTTGTGYAR
jgi:uncharacterized damage-inducible protein DinB